MIFCILPGKRFSSHDLLDDVSSESEEEEEEEEDADAELTALLHRRVIQVNDTGEFILPITQQKKFFLGGGGVGWGVVNGHG